MRLKYKKIRQSVVIRLRAWTLVLNVTVSFLPFSTYPLSSSCYHFLLHTPLWGFQSSAVYKNLSACPLLVHSLISCKIQIDLPRSDVTGSFIGHCFHFCFVRPVSQYFSYGSHFFSFLSSSSRDSHSDNFACINIPIFCLYPDKVYMVIVFQLRSPQSHNTSAINIPICPHGLM